MNNLNIFVSSTCYDLSQIRTNIKDFISDSGHNPVLSEINNFPVSPDLNSIENCIKNVKENADVLVLIVGARYGYVTDTGKSITNTEFLTARQKGIPIFCFIDKKMLNTISLWRDNKTADFSKIVDNTKIFEFIDDIRTVKNEWVFPFEESKEIIETLKIQFSYLFKESIKIRNIFYKNIDDFFKLNLTEKSLKILIEKNEYYEIEFLAQTFMDEMSKNEFLKNDVEYSILVEPKHFIKDLSELSDWGSKRLNSLMNITNNLSNLFPVMVKFVGEVGTPSDIKGLYYTSVKFSKIFEQLLCWMIDVKSTHISTEYSTLKIHLADMAKNVVVTLWDYPFKIKRELDKVKEQRLQGLETDKLDLNMQLEINEEAQIKFNEKLAEIKNTTPNKAEN